MAVTQNHPSSPATDQSSFASIVWVLGRNALQTISLVAGVVFIGDISLLRHARLLPGSASPDNKVRGQIRRRRFGMIVLAEVVVIGAVNILLANTNHAIWITPVTFLFVGLHYSSIDQT